MGLTDKELVGLSIALIDLDAEIPTRDRRSICVLAIEKLHRLRHLLSLL